MKKKGFTLVELLVVVAVIGLLASIIIVSLNTARKRAKNAAIKQALTQLRVAAEWEYDKTSPNNSYANVCSGGDINSDTTTDFGRIRDSIIAADGNTRRCYDSASKWCADVRNMPNGGGWCVDYTGYSSSTTNCDSTYFNCP